MTEQSVSLKSVTSIQQNITNTLCPKPIHDYLLSLATSRCEKGSCPPTLSVEICDATCGPTIPCNSTQICCPTVCGGSMCVDPMTQRHFVTLVKPGRCPEFPRGVWVCSHSCTGDSDCPRLLKCCPNRCGALTCQRPDADDPQNNYLGE